MLNQHVLAVLFAVTTAITTVSIKVSPSYAGPNSRNARNFWTGIKIVNGAAKACAKNPRLCGQVNQTIQNNLPGRKKR